jgi:uracil phosphoribosyltransferase
MKKVVILNHPLIQHRLIHLRDRRTPKEEFRKLVEAMGTLMAFEVTRDLSLKGKRVQTPLAKAEGRVLKGPAVAIIPILRAGIEMAEGMVKIIPKAEVGHIGIYRDEKTLKPVEYYAKLPKNLKNKEIIVVDPMLATGGSGVAAIDFLKEKGARKIRFVCLVAAPEGIKAIHRVHPEIIIYTAAIDKKLNTKGYIVPGLGDAGDRLFGT